MLPFIYLLICLYHSFPPCLFGGGGVLAVLLILITSVDKTQQDMSQNHNQDIVVGLHADLLVDKLALLSREA